MAYFWYLYKTYVPRPGVHFQKSLQRASVRLGKYTFCECQLFSVLFGSKKRIRAQNKAKRNSIEAKTKNRQKVLFAILIDFFPFKKENIPFLPWSKY